MELGAADKHAAAMALANAADDTPISHDDITRIMAALVDRADQDGRAHIAGMAVVSLLLTWPAEQRHHALDEAMQRFRRFLPELSS